MAIHYDRLFVDGTWIDPAAAGTITVISPNTEGVIGQVPEASEADVDRAVDATRGAFDSGWAQWAPPERAEAMERMADSLEKRAEEMARRVSSQNGMPITIAQQIEGGYPVALLRYYAGLIRETSFEEERPGLMGGNTLVRREPVGVVGAIVPWNFPQSIAMIKIAPALAMGCTVVVKPSPETVLDAFLFAEAIADADLPPGVVNIVPGGRELGAYLVSHPGIDKVAFTGSTGAGRSIAEVLWPSAASVTLELGGKSAAVILDDADLNLETAATELFTATLLNNGQCCFLGTPVLAPHSRYREVVDIFTSLAGSLTVGDSLDPATNIGPMASSTQRKRVESYIAKGRSEGATIAVGGCRPPGLDKGWFVEPTVFIDVDNSHTIAQEEIFGPVLAVIPYRDDDDAVRIANESDYGLGGSVWTTDPDRGLSVARRVQTGTIGINHYLADPTAPFGGVKASGLGRELGPEGLSAYQTIKSVYL